MANPITSTNMRCSGEKRNCPFQAVLPKTANLGNVWDSIIECCYRDLQVKSLAHADVISRMIHYKTEIIVFTLHAESRTRHYVAKVPLKERSDDDWNPKHEHDALVTLAHIQTGSQAWRVPTPVGYGASPPFLVTRYAPGSSMRALAEPGLRLWACANDTLTSQTLCYRAGESLRSFRSSTAQKENRAEPIEDSILTFYNARLDEIARFYGRRHVTRLCAMVERKLAQLFVPNLAECRPVLTYRYGCHGDFSLQNLLFDDRSVITILDLEGFRFTRLNEDAAVFRFRLEHLRLRPTFSNQRLTRCWQAFCDCFAETESDRLYLMVSYAHKLLAHLAWLPNPERRRSESVQTTVRNRLWARDRLAWLQRFVEVASIEESWGAFRHDL